MLVWTRGRAGQVWERGACVGRAEAAGNPQSQPLSFTMCDISMMYFPSLYFWLVSKACSWRRGGRQCGPAARLPPPAQARPPAGPLLLAPPSLWVRQTPDGWPLGPGGGGRHGDPPRLRGCPPGLTYFQPRVVLQLSQKISATECSPVSRRRCSAGPHPTLTLGDGKDPAHGRGVSLHQRTPKQPRGPSIWRARDHPAESPASSTPPLGV